MTACFGEKGGQTTHRKTSWRKHTYKRGLGGYFGGLEKLAEMSNWQTKLLQNLNGRRGRQGAGK